jgi:hypothetical protein
MTDKFQVAGFAAGLSPEEQKRLQEYSKSLSVHQNLIKMPADAAQAKYNTFTPAQKENLQKNFSNRDPVEEPSRNPLQSALHYTGGAAVAGVGKLFAGLQNVSDVMTRLYRTGAIAIDQNVDLGDAWDIANDKGDKVFSPDRITEAKVKFGTNAVDIAVRIASGEKPGAIMKSASPDQVKYLMLADPRNTKIPGIADDKIEAARANFQDTLDAVNAAKYSPGRFIANLVTPEKMEGSGLYYKAVSGAFDAAYRIFSDPLILAGKAKRAVDVMNYAVDVVVGGDKVADVFAKPAIQKFWDEYGSVIKELNKAEAEKAPEAIAIAKRRLATLAPEFGPAVIKEFQKAGIDGSQTAKAFFENSKQVIETFQGSIGRQRVIIPRMDLARQTRIAALTTGRKIFNLDAVGPKLVDDYFFGGSSTTDGIAETIINNQKQVVDLVTEKTNFKGIKRFSTAYIQYRIDRLKASLTPIPIFEKETFDVLSKDASTKIFQLARLVLPKRESTLLAEAFDNMTEVGKRKDVYYGLWATIADIRGVNTTSPGQQVTRYLIGKNKAVFGLGDDLAPEKGSMPSDFNNFVAAPGMRDLDIAAARNTLFQKLFGLANSDLANKMVSGWSFLTLAGPRYAIRNAGEDLMVNLAIGRSPWGLAKEYQLNTRINTYLQAAKELDNTVTWANNPLGFFTRMVNRREVNNIKLELVGIKNKFEANRTEIETLKRELSALKSGDPEIPVKRARLEELSNELKGGFEKQVREVFVSTLTAGRLNRWRESVGLEPMNAEEAAILKEHIIYGDLTRASEDVSEGGMNMFTGNDFITRAENLVKQTGVTTHALVIKPEGRFVKKPGTRGYAKLGVSNQDEASLHSWMFSISRYANDELGGIAIANLDNPNGPDGAIAKMVTWMTTTKEGKKFLADARVSNNMSAEEIARLNFQRARSLFVKSDDSLNIDLLNKVRVKDEVTDEWKVSGQLTFDDLAKLDEKDIPNAIVGPTLVPAVEIDKMTNTIMQNGWTFLGLSNARMSRQPIVLDEIVTIRKQFKKSGFEAKWIADYQKGINPSDVKKMTEARNKALEDLTQIVEERAIQQTVSYIDNPLVRSQLSWNIRNFARFYRATEDFYRRIYRVVKYNPEALVKASLTYEGITHSGWVQQDDQGNSYFVYPGISSTYDSVQKMLDALGIAGEFKIPFPVNFGANLKMVTPSLNQDSLFPTFSGPLAALPVTAITELVDIFNPGAADAIKGYTMGKYAIDQPILSAFLPAHINRAYAAMNTDERSSQYASAYRKAVTYLEASGHGIPKKYNADGTRIPPTAEELETYRQQVKSTTLSILGMRFVFGFFAPASPQVTLKSDMAQWISDNGRANFKQTWNDLRTQYDGNYDAAMAKWVELYPNQIPFTVTESERKTIAPFIYAEEAGFFVENNKELFKEYPNAAAYLMPHKSGFSFDAYKTMKDMGLITSKRVEDYLREVQTAADKQVYFAKKSEFDAKMSESLGDFERTDLRQSFESWKKVFFAGHPLVADELAEGQQKAIQRLKTLDELTLMLNKNPRVMPKTEAALRQMTDLYQKYKTERQNLEMLSGSQQLIKNLKTDTLLKMRGLAEYNENTKAVFDTIFGTLLGD